MKLLAAGDLHLGRRPSRLPSVLGGRDAARSLGPAGAWERMIDAAIANGVNAVVFAGDVVHGESDFFEAYRELQQGVVRLNDAGIAVFGVAGNHDVRVLPRLANQLEGFRLLGRGGTWENETIRVDGESLTLWGWSFPRETVTESPLAGAGFERGPGLNLGVLHCDRDQAGSPYAPVASSELNASGLDVWLLGHIHIPDTVSSDRPSGYLGSISGTDPGEPGARGPWLFTVSGGRIQSVEQWALAPLRWEVLDVSVESVAGEEEGRDRVLAALKKRDQVLAAGDWPPEAVGLRVRFSGRSRFGEEALAWFSEADREHIYAGASRTHYFVERFENRTRPEIPLEELAARCDPPGLLAARLLLLDRPPGDPERQCLLDEARAVLNRQAGDSRWAGLRQESLSEEAVADWLHRAGTAALERLLAQQEKTV